VRQCGDEEPKLGAGPRAAATSAQTPTDRSLVLGDDVVGDVAATGSSVSTPLPLKPAESTHACAYVPAGLRTPDPRRCRPAETSRALLTASDNWTFERQGGVLHKRRTLVAIAITALTLALAGIAAADSGQSGSSKGGSGETTNTANSNNTFDPTTTVTPTAN